MAYTDFLMGIKELAEQAASLRSATWRKDLSLGGRCLALDLYLNLEIVTASENKQN